MDPPFPPSSWFEEQSWKFHVLYPVVNRSNRINRLRRFFRGPPKDVTANSAGKTKSGPYPPSFPLTLPMLLRIHFGRLRNRCRLSRSICPSPFPLPAGERVLTRCNSVFVPEQGLSLSRVCPCIRNSKGRWPGYNPREFRPCISCPNVLRLCTSLRNMQGFMHTFLFSYCTACNC